MEKISHLLDRFKKTLSNHKTEQNIFKEAVFDCLDVLLETKEILLKEGCVYIKCNSVIKNEIMINKEKILLVFHKKGGSSGVRDIK